MILGKLLPSRGKNQTTFGIMVIDDIKKNRLNRLKNSIQRMWFYIEFHDSHFLAVILNVQFQTSEIE